MENNNEEMIDVINESEELTSSDGVNEQEQTQSQDVTESKSEEEIMDITEDKSSEDTAANESDLINSVYKKKSKAPLLVILSILLILDIAALVIYLIGIEKVLSFIK